MYHHLAMKQPDREKFQEAVKKESKAHYKEGNYRLVAKYVRLHEQYGTENKFLPRKEGNL